MSVTGRQRPCAPTSLRMLESSRSWTQKGGLQRRQCKQLATRRGNQGHSVSESQCPHLTPRPCWPCPMKVARGPNPQMPRHPGASLQLSEGCPLLSTGGWGQKPAGEGPASFHPPNGNQGPSGIQHPSPPTPWTNQIPIFLMRNMNGRNQHLGCAGPQG